MKTLTKICLILLFTSINYFAQWTKEWNSNSLVTGVVSGWLSFKQTGDQWEERFYEINASSLIIKAGNYSNSQEYIYKFTAEELTAGNQIYSLGYDLTGDGIVEFYVLAYYGSSDNYRQSFKIIDITSGATKFEMNDAGFYYSYPVVWDVDNDGTLECTFTKSDYPDYA